MQKPALVIMAAGLGSRYGGLKQIDSVGPGGEILIDYSIYDALKAGFSKIVFIIRKETEEAFREKIGYRAEKLADTEYVFQSMEDLPASFLLPPDRKKPWGTGHAVLSCRKAVNVPFAVINADDFYGASTFRLLFDYLKTAEDRDGVFHYSMAGFQLENTLTEHGHVARGVCTVDREGFLSGIRERTRIQKFEDGTKYTEDGTNWVTIPAGSTVSMNTWGFTPSLLDELESGFPQFLRENREQLAKAEYFLPSVVDRLIQEGKARVKVLETKERWYGVTYQEDKPVVKQAILDLIRQGAYPEKLWRE
jgi:dTDP-glucose pyrophosphorylase